MKKYLVIYFIIFISLNTFSQEHTVYIDAYAVSSNITSFTITKSNYSKEKEIKGNPYYNKEWMFGELKIKNNSSYSGLFKYNIHQQQMEMIHKKDTFIISKPLYVEYVKFSNKTFIYSLIISTGKGAEKISGSYFRAHNNLEDNYVLLSKFRSDIKVNDYGTRYAGNIGDGSKRYTTNKSFYVKLFNGPAQKVNLSTNGIAKLFSDKKIVKKYIKKNKLNMNNAKDVVLLFDHFNKLNL